ncbi:hypothetical protein KHS38_05595 [Mucilaginibacter sp. Bleaf8]|uniref:hypothetical protein n=1 Tax=Mucilaginibacter sp. Bleaf8 TaxID=2834430 RepID=UPI001BCBA94F|nr:hypothetical protein [Mucilaginibacter sp. Bleaf8]MBS7563871.1 hypothetical protein [Mucilaginibacter sp. Bleaf8]
MNSVANGVLSGEIIKLCFLLLAIGTGLYGAFRILGVYLIGVNKGINGEFEDVLIVGVVNIGISLVTLAWMVT